nr:MAG TPA: Large Terminase [Caudoviricetes sp.]
MSSPSSRYVPPERDGYECVRYMDAVLGGELVACKKIIKLCKILRPRFETGEYKCWHYDPARAKRPIEFAERFCCQPEGKPGQHIEMQPFQMFWQEVVFGWVDEQGFRQFNEAFNVRGRKNGKSTEQACMGLYMLTKDGEGAPQCYSAANSKPQSSLLYGSMLRMVSQSPALRRRLHKGTIPNRDEDGLIYRANGGYFTPLSSQTRNQDGLNVHFAAIDEVAAVTNRDIYDLLKQATSARDQPLIVEITTNGFERDNFFDSQYDYASRWLDGKVEDDHFLPVIYELDDRCEWSDEDMWVKANPGIDVIKKREALRGYVNKAKQDPSFLPTVMTKDFDLPENRASAWLSFEQAVNRETFDWREMGFRYCIIGYDASDTIDLTSAQALMMRPGDPKIYEMSMYWIPEMQLEKYRTSGLRKQRDNVPYDRWIEEGLVRTCPGNTIDHRVVFEWMQELRDEFDVYPFAMGYDPWHLQDDSWKDTARQFVGKNRAEQVRFGAQTLSIPMKEIKEVYAAKGIVDNDNPVNQWCRMNVGVMTDTNDNIKPVKANGPTGRIDGWAAEICAYVCLKRHWEDYMASI